MGLLTQRQGDQLRTAAGTDAKTVPRTRSGRTAAAAGRPRQPSSRTAHGEHISFAARVHASQTVRPPVPNGTLESASGSTRKHKSCHAENIWPRLLLEALQSLGTTKFEAGRSHAAAPGKRHGAK